MTDVQPEAKRPWFKKKRIMIPLAILVLIIAVSAGGNDDKKDKGTNAATEETTKAEKTTTTEGNTDRISLAEFNEITEGMTYDEVTGIIGGPGTVASSSDMAGTKTVMYTWEGSNDSGLGANANAMFQNDKMITKAQFGLK